MAQVCTRWYAKSYCSDQKMIVDIETMHMVKKGQLHCTNGQTKSATFLSDHFEHNGDILYADTLTATEPQ